MDGIVCEDEEDEDKEDEGRMGMLMRMASSICIGE